MIQVVAEKLPEGKYNLVPVLEKPKTGQNPASYVVNKAKYIQFLSFKMFKPIPVKYKFRKNTVSFGISDTFVDDVEKLYVETILELLPDAKTGDGPGMFVNGGDGYKIEWRGNTPLVSLGNVIDTEIFIPFKSNEKLCKTIVALVEYRKE